MCKQGSLGMCEMDLRGGVGVGMNQVSHNMSLAIQSAAMENAAYCGYAGLFEVSDGGPGARRCVNQGTRGWVS